MKNLSKSEMLQINGGGKGSPAYKAGREVGEYLHDAVDFINGIQAIKWAVELF